MNAPSYARSQLESAFDNVDLCMQGLDDDTYNWQPSGTCNPISKLHVHIVSSMDFFTNSILQGKRSGWPEVAAQVAEAPAIEIAEFLVREGTAIRVGSDRYYDRLQLEGAARKVLGAIRSNGQVTPSEVRDVLGLTRKYLIPILGWMDSVGLTVRVGDARRLGPAANQTGWDA